MFQYEYERPSVTCDIAVVDLSDLYRKKLLLIKRGGEPFKDYFALPGGFMNRDEDIYDCAIRELNEETTIKLSKLNPYLEFVGVFSSPYRDPRGWTISNLFVYRNYSSKPLGVIASDDAVDFKWLDITHNNFCGEKLAFDHIDMIHAVRNKYSW